MNKRYTFNKYGNYIKESIYDVTLINKTSDNYLQFDGLEKYACGNVDKKQILDNKINDINDTKIRVLNKPYTGQLYFDNYYHHPILPIEQPTNAIEKWQRNQPLSFSNFVDEYPVEQLNDDKLIAKYDNPNMYRRIFFNQNDGRR